jgi:hypothetical protein
MTADEERQEASLTGNQPENADAVPNQAGEEGTNPAQGTPPIGDSGQKKGQTQVPAPDDDVGVPEELDDHTH